MVSADQGNPATSSRAPQAEGTLLQYDGKSGGRTTPFQTGARLEAGQYPKMMKTAPESARGEAREVKRLPQSPPHPMGTRAARHDSLKMSVVVIDEASALASYVAEWEDLAAAAIEPNPFYEPWMLLPALRAFGGGKTLSFVLVFAPHPTLELGAPLLCGFFPLERRRYRKLPISVLSFWQHLHAFLCTPLLREGYAAQCLSAYFEWLESVGAGCALMEFNFIAGDGPFHQLLIDQLRERASLFCITEMFTRALFRPAADAETYLQSGISGRRRKELRRQGKRFAEAGRLEYAELAAREDVERWIEGFLGLEAGGWKGRAGTAISASEAEREFFATIVREAFLRGRLMMLAARLNGRFVAQKCNFLAGAGAFAFKIAYDESYAQFSPGVHLEIENIRRLHERPRVEWMDSCSVSDNFINSLWPHRRTILTALVATGRSPGGLVVSSLPFLRWLNRRNPFRPRARRENRERPRRTSGRGASPLT
jgi:CelD/BcsL family acetyltransferase involved in cellulose biosynthesis